jgi:CRISPR-associated protein Cmr2
VWKDPAHTPQIEGQLALRLRLSPGEQLDVVGLTKRISGGRKNYPSVSRIAADPWLRGAANAQPKAMDELKAACDELAKAHRLARVDWPEFDAFPYEGTAVYSHRHKEIIEETHCPESALADLRKRLNTVAQHRRHPEPYLAVLAADGDQMGKAISAMSSANQHRDFSRLLAGFAAHAAGIVRSHHGCLVYSGGDDVLAFLPLDECLPCARELHQAFRTTMQSGPALTEQPTLSVGLGLGHFMDPLEDLLEYARAAEKAAKRPDRDGLAIHLHPRSGAPICMRRRWGDDPDQRIERWAALLLSERISDKSAYDLRDLARDYHNWPAETDEEKSVLARAIRTDAARLLARKARDREDASVQELEQLIAAAKSADQLEEAAKEVLIARRIARAQRQASGGRS